jgi:hypothetical protein
MKCGGMVKNGYWSSLIAVNAKTASEHRHKAVLKCFLQCIVPKNLMSIIS